MKEPDYDEQQCHYCQQWFPAPVNLHHAEDECLANQTTAKESVK